MDTPWRGNYQLVGRVDGFHDQLTLITFGDAILWYSYRDNIEVTQPPVMVHPYHPPVRTTGHERELFLEEGRYPEENSVKALELVLGAGGPR